MNKSELKTPQAHFFKGLQEDITQALNTWNQKSFQQDNWQREGGGGGDTRIYVGGAFLEKGGVNFSEVFGKFTPEFAKNIPYGEGLDFYATGVSLVLHPENPFIPTVHANFRYIQRGSVGWFGGGADLTPYYVDEADAIHFHRTFFEALSPFGSDKYEKFKKHCDEYFYLPHRQETRGIGGIFFDYQMESDSPFEMVQSCGNAFLKAYLPIVERQIHKAYSAEQKEFQEYRRGRYVEFNLLYDRGTLFGLKTNGRVESILMSLPLKARWGYDYKPKEGSLESQLYNYLKPIDWCNLHSSR